MGFQDQVELLTRQLPLASSRRRFPVARYAIDPSGRRLLTGVYRVLMPESMISFEHAVFLLTALVRGDELVLSACRECSAVLIIDRWSLRAPRCALCVAESLAAPTRGLQDWRPDDSFLQLNCANSDAGAPLRGADGSQLGT